MIGFEEQDDDLFVLVVRLTTFTEDGEPDLDEEDPDDVQIPLGEPNVYFDCKKLHGSVPAVHLPEDEDMM